MRARWLGLAMVPGMLACGGLFGSVRSDLDAICEDFQTVNTSVGGEERAIALAARIQERGVSSETEIFLKNHAVADVPSGQRYDAWLQFASENGASDWTCPAMEHQDDADALCIAITEAVAEQPAKPFARLNEKAQAAKWNSEAQEFALSLEAMGPGQRVENVREFVADQGGFLSDLCAQELPPYERQPEAVVQSYLELMTQSKATEAVPLISSTCLTTPIATGEPVQVLGATIQATEIRVDGAVITGTTAEIPYTVSGPASAQNTQTTFLGMSVSVGSMQMDNATRSGTLKAVIEDGIWKIGCP